MTPEKEAQAVALTGSSVINPVAGLEGAGVAARHAGGSASELDSPRLSRWTRQPLSLSEERDTGRRPD